MTITTRQGFSAVLAMSLCAGTLVASEFLPVALLTPLANDLSITEGRAGQAISISGLFAVATSLLSARLTRRIDRKVVQAMYIGFMIASGLIVTLAPNYAVLMFGRALLGVAVGGFWSMSTAVVLRVLDENRVASGLAVINAGVAISSILSAPLGSWLGSVIGWRGTFFALVPVAILAQIWQWRTMPSLPPRGRMRANPLALLGRLQVLLGMLSILCMYMGHFALFTYLRPYLDDAGLPVPMISLAYLGLGLAGLLGTWMVVRLLPAAPFATLIALPFAMAVVAVALVFAANSQVAVFILMALWGLVATAAPIGWGSWLARVLGDEAETGGGLQVAVIQLAIMAGAALGGVIFDAAGWEVTFTFAAVLLALSSGFAAATRWHFHH